MSHANKIAAILLCSASLMPFATPAFAQSDPRAPQSTALDDVIVTARKREESLQDVPVSVATVSEQVINNYALTSLSDLTNKLPNFVMPAGSPTSLTDVSVRGVNAGVRNAGFSSSISNYVDGIFQGRPANFNQILNDIDRVELLLGPQGTLFGNNTIAGVINIITARPTQDANGYVQQSIGNYGFHETKIGGNAPITDTLSTRLTGAYQSRDGYVQNLFTGNDAGNFERGAVRWQLLNKTDNTSILFTAGFQSGSGRLAIGEYIEQGSSGLPATPPFNSGFNAAPEPFRLLQDPSTTDYKRLDLSLHIEHEISPSLTLFAISGYKDSETDDLFDGDGAADQRLRNDITNLENQKIFSQEIRLESDASQRFNYVVGAYYLNDKVDLVRSFFYRPPFSVLGPLGALDLGIDTVSQLETSSYAAFGNIQYDILPNLELSVGMRYSAEQMDAFFSQKEVFRALGQRTNQVLPLGPVGGLLISNGPDYIDDRSDELYSGTATLTYHVTDNKMIYGRYARGTKSGGFNLEPLPNPLPTDRSFGRETLDNYELGAKTQWWDNRFRFNITAFFQQYHDLQRADVIPIVIAPGVTGFTRVIRNAAEVEIKGLEASAELVPIDGLTLSAAYGQADAVFFDYTILSGVDLTGTKLTGVPKWNATLAADYVREIGQGYSLSIGASAELRGERALGSTDAVAVGVAGYHVINTYLSISPPDGGWSLNFWANNITDELYVTARGAANDFFNADLVGFGLPRTFGATVRVKFGAY